MIAATEGHTPIWVPLAFLLLGVPLIVHAAREGAFPDPGAYVRKIAEARARTPFIGPNDVDKQFAQQWRLRWVMVLAPLGYFAATGC